ncbi:MAG: hypothetical protein Q8911_01230 [Bacillota bacterium]|nr:hypothetical protein [Bacillota bacterium]
MITVRMSSSGDLIIAGNHYSTEANLNNAQSLDGSFAINDSASLDQAAESQSLLNALLGVTTSEEQTSQIRFDQRGNLLAQVVQDQGATKVSIGNNKIITVKTLITGGVL